jgi:hypothetical protein
VADVLGDLVQCAAFVEEQRRAVASQDFATREQDVDALVAFVQA